MKKLLFVVVLAACGGDGDGLTARLVVGGIEGAGGTTQMGVLDLAELPASGNAYSYVALEGVRIKLRGLSMSDPLIDGGSYIDLEGEVLEMGQGAGAANLEREITVNPGTYSEVTLEFYQEIEYMGACRTEDYLVYTTPAGIERIDCTMVDCDTATLTDYGFFRYEFLSAQHGGGPTATDDWDGEFTYTDFNIAAAGEPMVIDGEEQPVAGVPPTVAVLFDNSYFATCYDGSETLTQDEHDGSLSPFHGNTENGALNDYFPNDAPNMGTFKMNLITWVSTDENPPLPVAETYMASPRNDVFGAEALDWSQVLFTTMVFEGDGTLYGAVTRSAGYNGDGGMGPTLQLSPQWTAFERDGDDYDLFNGAVRGVEGQANAVVRDRRVVDFQRLDFGENLTTSVENGPDCGSTDIITDGEPLARDCLGAPETAYWRRLRRADE